MPKFLTTLLICLPLEVFAEASYVSARLWGRLGNQLFIIAATTSLALDNGATATFPDFSLALQDNAELAAQGNYAPANLRANYNPLFSHLNCTPFSHSTVYREPAFTYQPIPYQPNMVLEGWFQSEKYFRHHKDAIRALFAPPLEIKKHLQEKYRDILEHPNSVAIHLRCYVKEDPALEAVYPTYGRDYVKRAMRFFRKAQYVVFSDQIAWAKEQLAGLPARFRFIENESVYNDFYLMSMCKHNIISNSSFSWWAAYLNNNQHKIVTVPALWFSPEYQHDTTDLIPEGWTRIEALRCRRDGR